MDLKLTLACIEIHDTSMISTLIQDQHPRHDILPILFLITSFRIHVIGISRPLKKMNLPNVGKASTKDEFIFIVETLNKRKYFQEVHDLRLETERLCEWDVDWRIVRRVFDAFRGEVTHAGHELVVV